MSLQPHVDAVSGEPVRLVPIPDRPDHFADTRIEDRLAAQAEQAISKELRFDQHRDLKLRAARGWLLSLITEADAGDGIAASRVVQAASADLIIPLLVERLREAKALIPGHVENEAARLRIDAAINAAGQ